ncbi:MAG: hypothetical protein ACYCPM_10895, partial [Acidobacteriaceae bacterium]
IQNPSLRWAGVVGLLLLLAGLGWAVWGYVHQRMTASTSSSPTHYAASFVNPTAALPRVEAPLNQTHRRRSRSLP